MERCLNASPEVLRGILRKLPLFESFTDNDLDRLLATGFLEVVSFNQGETIIEEGNYEKTFFILLRGGVRVIKGTKVIVDMAAAGTIFGEMSFILGQGRTATVAAINPTECLQVNMAYIDFFPGPEREEYLTRIFRYLSGIVESRLGSANAKKAAILTAIREREEAIREFTAAKNAEIDALKRDLAALNTADDEEVLRRILDKRY